MSWLVTAVFAVGAAAAPPPVHTVEVSAVRDYQVANLPYAITINARTLENGTLLGKRVIPKNPKYGPYCGTARLRGLVQVKGGEESRLTQTKPFCGSVTLKNVRVKGDYLRVTIGEGTDAATTTWTPSLRKLPGVLSLLAPLFAIVLALVFRNALIALLAGVWLGALFLHGYNPLIAAMRTFDTYLAQSLGDKDHAAVIMFTMALGGMVGVITRSGGTRSLVDAIARRAATRRSGMITTWVSGIVVFFDDYANCLLVGNSVRPFTDKLKISREKLSYLVDSTAAPVSTIALISTWVGFQVDLLDDLPAKTSGYDLFLGLLPFSFYSLFTLAFVFMIAWTMRDFGPMRRAERRAYTSGQVLRPGAKPLMDPELTEMQSADNGHWITAILPIVAIVLFVMIGLYYSGRLRLGDAAAGASLRAIVGKADSYAVLLWASFGGSIVAMAVALWKRTMTASESVEAWLAGAKAMAMAIFILVLAWTLGDICKNYLLTGPWLISQVNPSPKLLPLITFVISAIIALATGSSFSTMAIVIPIAGPLVWAATGGDVTAASSTDWTIRYATLAAVLSGAVFGDHCSPISDTTIMSSMSAASDHVDHVRTQAPYAFVCAGVAGVVGFLPAGWGISPLYTLPVGIAILYLVVRYAGRRVDEP